MALYPSNSAMLTENIGVYVCPLTFAPDVPELTATSRSLTNGGTNASLHTGDIKYFDLVGGRLDGLWGFSIQGVTVAGVSANVSLELGALDRCVPSVRRRDPSHSPPQRHEFRHHARSRRGRDL